MESTFSIFNILQLVGGVALFLYGMNVMGDGLEKLGGGKLEKLLERLTSTRIKGVLLGALVTGVIQSSAATTVMVVGFVNSGIMKLQQSVGIIMGANIGTTVTAWILSLSAIQGTSLITEFLKPTNFTPIFALVGIIIIMGSKKSRMKNIGNICIGFAVLMFGMNTMSSALSDLKDSETFLNILTMFSNPLLGIVAGAIMTAILQSSSASMGILQALSATGKITFGAALPLIMGQNIGSCVTCLISCIGTSKNAKRAAIIHLYFNMIGTVLFLTLFYAANAVFRFTFVSGTVNAFNIAVVHTVFNILTTAVLLPFSNVLVKIAKLTVKDGNETDMFSVLDERFFQNPQFALDNCKTLTANMAYIARETLDYTIHSIKNYSDKLCEAVMENEETLDRYEDALSRNLVKVSARCTGNHQSREVTLLLRAIGEFERMTDYEANIMYTSREKSDKSAAFSGEAERELEIFAAAVTEIMDKTITAFTKNDIREALSEEPLFDVIDTLGEELRRRHIARVRSGKCAVDTGALFADYITAYEKIAVHCKNTAAYVVQMNDSSFLMHSEAHEKRRASEEYKAMYEEYRKKYPLPFTADKED